MWCARFTVLVKTGQMWGPFLFKFLKVVITRLVMCRNLTDQRVPGPVSCRCPEPRVGLLETLPRWQATIYSNCWYKDHFLASESTVNLRSPLITRLCHNHNDLKMDILFLINTWYRYNNQSERLLGLDWHFSCSMITPNRSSILWGSFVWVFMGSYED